MYGKERNTEPVLVRDPLEFQPRRLASPPPARAPEPVTQRSNWLEYGSEALIEGRWIILLFILLGGACGYVYSAKLCVPLYRIDASIEIKNSTSGARVETLAHILASQSLIIETLGKLPADQRGELLEMQFLPFLARNDNEVLRKRLKATATPSANVIDIEFITPSRRAGEEFVDLLIRGLRQRVAGQRSVSSETSLPDEWTADAGTPTESIVLIDPAIPSTDPVSPNTFANVWYGLGGGLVLGILLAFLRKNSANTFRGPGSLRQALGVRELGTIPERKLLTAPGSEDDVAAQIDSNDESMRYLRSSLLYHPGGQKLHALAFTSAAPGEGKTSVVTSLSMSLASSGRRILVIDGDLRRPRLHRILQVQQSPGLADLLRRDSATLSGVLAKHIHASSFQNLWVIPPGSGGTDTPELLAGPVLPHLIDELVKSYDFVLIDTPPLLACSDARNYARVADGVVLVVRSSETQKRAALVARDMLLQDGANIVGTVLTGWRQASPVYSYPPASSFTKS